MDGTTMSSVSIEQREQRIVLPWKLIIIASMALVSVLYGFSLARPVPIIILILAPLAVALMVGALFKPELAAIVLVGVVWGYLSDVAEKLLGVPSLLYPLVGLLMLVLVFRRLSSPRLPWVYDTMTWWMLAYMLMIALALWYAADPNRVPQLLLPFVRSFLIYLVVINLIVSPSSFERSMGLLVGIGALLGTLAIYQEVTKSYASDFGGLARRTIAYIADGLNNRPRASGPLSDPNGFGQQLLVLVPIGLWTMMRGRTLWRRLFGAYATAACIAGIGLSFSRGALVGLLVVLVLFALHIRLNPRYLILVVPILAVLWWAAPSEFTARSQTLEELLPGNQGVDSEASYRGRSIAMRMAVNMFTDHPFLGVGASNYPTRYQEYIRKDGSPVEDKQTHPHSYYLEIAAEQGLFGLMVVGGILVITIRRLRSAQRRFAAAGDARMSSLAAALQIGFVSYLVTALFLHGAYSPFLWLQVALAVALATIAGREGDRAAQQRLGSA
jgi:putative inorganic carbon (hco3(-)) transporter